MPGMPGAQGELRRGRWEPPPVPVPGSEVPAGNGGVMEPSPPQRSRHPGALEPRRSAVPRDGGEQSRLPPGVPVPAEGMRTHPPPSP